MMGAATLLHICSWAVLSAVNLRQLCPAFGLSSQRHASRPVPAPQVVLTGRHLAVVMSHEPGGDLKSYCARFPLNEVRTRLLRPSPAPLGQPVPERTPAGRAVSVLAHAWIKLRPRPCMHVSPRC